MHKEVIWSDASIDDVTNIIGFLLDKWSPLIAANFLDNLEGIVKRISISPNSFPLINKEVGIRKCVISKHNCNNLTEK